MLQEELVLSSRDNSGDPPRHLFLDLSTAIAAANGASALPCYRGSELDVTLGD